MDERNTTAGCGICCLLFGLAAFFMMGINFYFLPFIPMFPFLFIILFIVIVIVSVASSKSKRVSQDYYQKEFYPKNSQNPVPKVNPYKIENSSNLQNQFNTSNYQGIEQLKPIETRTIESFPKLIAQYCSFCGEKIEKDAAFCHQCGTKLK